MLPNLTRTISDLESRQQRGSALLDEKAPGWRDHLSPAELDMAECYECVLGQLYGEYAYGLGALLGDVAELGQEAALGFNALPYHRNPEEYLLGERGHTSYLNQFQILTVLWTADIKGVPWQELDY